MAIKPNVHGIRCRGCTALRPRPQDGSACTDQICNTINSNIKFMVYLLRVDKDVVGTYLKERVLQGFCEASCIK